MKVKHIAQILVAVPVGVAFIFTLFGGANVNFEEVGLGVGTASFHGSISGHSVHGSRFETVHDVRLGWMSRGENSVALWLGNSQLHGVNQYAEGDESAPVIAHRALAPLGVDLITFSIPNANLQEHYVYFAYLIEQFQVDKLFLPLVFDDMREDGIRPFVSPCLEFAFVREALSSSIVGQEILKLNQVDASEAGRSERVDSLQDKSEKRLNEFLDDVWSGWSLRSQVRGKISLFLYNLRNTVFGISPTSKRKMIPARYDRNLRAYEAILDLANSRGIKVYIYIAPIRNDFALPYDMEEYGQFKQEAERVALGKDAVFFSLEDVVPNEFWGMKKATDLGEGEEVDFMHFSAQGHAILAESIASIIKKEVLEKNGL